MAYIQGIEISEDEELLAEEMGLSDYIYDDEEDAEAIEQFLSK